MKKLINEALINGYLYEHKLEKKVTGENSKHPGTEYITGTISIATDEARLNVVPVHYTYVTATTQKGGPNINYLTLNKIIEDNPSVINVGKENALKVRIASQIDLNEWFSDVNDESPQSVKRNEGGIIHTVNQWDNKEDGDTYPKSAFKTDMVITGVRDIDANPERNTPEKVAVKGYIFNPFRKTCLPVEFSVLNPGGMNYFRGLEASGRNPVFTCVWGEQISQTVYNTIKEDGAFGEAYVKRVPNSNKDFVIKGTSREVYDWDDESTILASELKKMLEDREVLLAGLKARRMEANTSPAPSPSAAVSAKKGNYDF